jgi:hypothetical protein
MSNFRWPKHFTLKPLGNLTEVYILPEVFGQLLASQQSWLATRVF